MADITLLPSDTDGEAINGVIFLNAAPRNSGTGGYNTFLAIRDNDGTEQGFNSDANGPTNTGPAADQNNIDASKTMAIRLSSLPVEIRMINGVPTEVYVIRLDLNETDSTAGEPISLTQFKIYTGGYTATNGTIIDTVTELNNAANTTLRYDLDAGGDNTLLLRDQNSGSGTDDYEIVIPVSTLGNASVANDYLYIFAQFTNNDGGFEEFNAQNAFAITGTKFNDANANGVRDAGEAGVAGVTIFIDADSDQVLDAGERSTVTDAMGNYTFGGLLAGTYRIDEVVPMGQIQSTGDFETITVTNFTAGQVFTVDPIGNFTPAPSFTLVKSIDSVSGGVVNATLTTADDAVNSAGDQITYKVVLVNTGNVALTSVNVADTLEGMNFNEGNAVQTGGNGPNNDAIFQVGETWTYTFTKTVLQGEIDNNGGVSLPGDGLITNTATATAMYNTTTVMAGPSTVNTPIVRNPAIDVTKSVVSVTGGFDNGTPGDLTDDRVDSANDTINYRIAIANTGNVSLTGVTVTDQVEAFGATNATYVSGDSLVTGTVGVLDVGETWVYSASYTTTQADINSGNTDNDIDNTATGDTAQTDPDMASAAVLKVYNPTVDLEKLVSINGTTFVDADTAAIGPQNVAVQSAVFFKVIVDNTGNVNLTNLKITDINTTGGGAGTTITLYENGALNPALVGVANSNLMLSGDVGNDGILGIDEVWTLTYTQGFDFGQHVNTAFVTTTQGARDNDAAFYFGILEGPGVRTPGFWSNLGAGFWDGSAAVPKTGVGFTQNGDLLIYGNTSGRATDDPLTPVREGDDITTIGTIEGDANGDGVVTVADKGLLIGDYNRNGTTDAGEDTLFISIADAKQLIDASQKTQSGDGVQMLGRDVVATWLNYLAGNGIGGEADVESPRHFIDDAVDWLQKFAGKDSDTSATDSFDIYNSLHTAVKTSSATWNTAQSPIDHSASTMHTALDTYNNTGDTFAGGTPYAMNSHSSFDMMLMQAAYQIV